ncbi:MAG TPA: cysteine--tRNA ligase [Gammaproteobacteria bacterium]|nr:cysteine--tRNA ligase [Gammaproteobacteria bacterium]
MLRIHNSLTGRKEPFVPMDPGAVRMYVCGITVYDFLHLGHARMLVVFDVIARWLRASGYPLTFVRNITDIDDKIIRRAAENGEPVSRLTERFIAEMNRDCASLGVLAPDHEPRATEWIPAMVDMIGRLMDGGYAYRGDNGDVYYKVSRFGAYGRLSGKKLADLRAGARVEVDEAKLDPLDFVLWKAARPGEPAWESPWGKGRPGWHIECSAMATGLLGDTFDIHGGGMDLKFPHHENEIAQSEAATGQRFARVWVHNGFVRIDEEKMSKSLGNFFTARDILQSWQAETVRYFLLASHYRSPLNYATDNLRQAKAGLDRLYIALRGLPEADAEPDSPHASRFAAAMDDDFNTAEAIAVLQTLAREMNAARAGGSAERAARLGATLKSLGAPLGLAQGDPDSFLKGAPAGGGELDGSLEDGAIEAIIEARSAARRAGDWQEADRLRDRLLAAGIVIEDAAEGTRWRR